MPTSDTKSVATTLPARYYTDPNLFRDELERFYCQTWICVGRANQVPSPGDYFLREVADESIIITCDENSSLRAFFNVCRRSEERRVGKECRYWRDWSSDVCSSDLSAVAGRLFSARGRG